MYFHRRRSPKQGSCWYSNADDLGQQMEKYAWRFAFYFHHHHKDVYITTNFAWKETQQYIKGIYIFDQFLIF